MTRARRRPSRSASAASLLAVAFAALAATLLAAGCAREALVPTRPPEVRLKPHEEVVLDGSGSFDPEGEELAYRWRQVAGPPVELKGADTPWPRFTPTGPGRYEFELVVAAPPEGGEGAPLEGPPVRLAVDVLPPNRPPRIEIAPVVRAEPGQWAVLDGGGAEDPDGDVLSFRWELVGGEAKGSTLPPATLVEMDPFDGRDRRVRVRGWRAGVYRFRLTVSDAFGAEATADTVLLVAPNDLPPVGIPRVKGGASSGAPGGSGDGGRLASGHFALRLGAWPHPKGGVNEPPIAVARAEGPDQDGWVVIDGSASRDPNGDALYFHWYRIAGPRVRVLRPVESTGAPVPRADTHGFARMKFVPPAPGRYVYRLVVTDGVLESAPAEVSFVVPGEAAASPGATPPAPPAAPEGIPPFVTVTTGVAADAGGDVTVETGVEVALDGRRSRAPRNAKLVHDWRQVAGPRVTSFRLDPVEGGARPRFTPESAGQYEFELRVSLDRVLWSAPDRVRVTVLGANRPPWIEAPRVVLARAGEVVRVAASWGDPDGDPTRVAWRRVGGGRATLTQDAGLAELAAPEGGC
ncbi:MAG: PKD domain-containing protein, partial [Planctomycetota bacterium]